MAIKKIKLPGMTQPVDIGVTWANVSGKPDLITSEEATAYMQKGADYVTAGQDLESTLGLQATAEGYYTTASGDQSHAEGSDTTASGNQSHAEGNNTTASGQRSHAEGNETYAIEEGSHAEGEYTHAGYYQKILNQVYMSLPSGTGGTKYLLTLVDNKNDYYPFNKGSCNIEYNNQQYYGTYIKYDADEEIGEDYIIVTISDENLNIPDDDQVYVIISGESSHAEGYGACAFGNYSHAEGSVTTASGESSHAEGNWAQAEGVSSHAEGYRTTASGDYSHAEGSYATASGQASHAEGIGTIANHKSQHVFGEHNIADDSTATASSRGNYVEIVGNGTRTAHSNARTLDWNGNEVLAGKLTVGTAPTENMDVATKQYVDNILATNDAMIFKGTIGTGGTVTQLPATHEAGWTYKVITAGSLAGQPCEIGDMIICIADGTVATADDWTVIQTNIDGVVTGPASSTAEHIATFTGTTGKVIQDSGFTIAKSVPADAQFTDTTYENKTAASGGTDVSLVTTGDKYIWNNKGTYSKPSGGIPASDLASDVIPSAYTLNPVMNGTANAGTSTSWAKGDHVHPIDISRQAKITVSGILKGDGAGGVSEATAGIDYATPAQVDAKATKPTKKSISLSTTWSGSGPYTQTVIVSGYTITANSKVDLQPDASVIEQLITDSVQGLFVTNDSGTLTITAIGAAPSVALNIQCIITEVST